MNMKNILSLFMALFFVSVSLSAFAEGPKLVVEETDFDFGQIFAGEQVTHVFTLRNEGDQSLTVDRVRSSCGCTAALLSSKVIPAGESGEIKATFDSARFKGAVVKTIYVYANDPARKVTQLYIRGTVLPEIALNPERVDLGPLVPETIKEARVTLTNQGKATVTLYEPRATVSELTAKLSTSILEPGQSAEILIEAKPTPGKARLSGYLLVKTDSANLSELRIPVYGSVVDISKEK